MKVVKVLLRLAKLGNGLTLDRDIIGAINIGLRYLNPDGSPVPLGSTATHEPTVITRDLWARWKPLDATMNLYKMIGMNIKGQTVSLPQGLYRDMPEAGCPANSNSKRDGVCKYVA